MRSWRALPSESRASNDNDPNGSRACLPGPWLKAESFGILFNWAIPIQRNQTELSLVEQAKLTQSLQPFTIGQIAIGRGHKVSGTTEGADPVFGVARAIERRQASGIEDMIAQNTTGLTCEPSRACFHDDVEVSSYSS